MQIIITVFFSFFRLQLPSIFLKFGNWLFLGIALLVNAGLFHWHMSIFGLYTLHLSSYRYESFYWYSFYRQLFCHAGDLSASQHNVRASVSMIYGCGFFSKCHMAYPRNEFSSVLEAFLMTSWHIILLTFVSKIFFGFDFNMIQS